MLLPEIFILAGLALAIRALPVFTTTRGTNATTRGTNATTRGTNATTRGTNARGWLVFAASVVCLFWLQPSTPVRYLDFWLPVATLALTVLAWLLVTPAEQRFQRGNLLAGGLLVGLVLLVALTRYIGGGSWLTPSRPPAIGAALGGLAWLALALGGLALWLRRTGPGAAPYAALAAAIGLLIVVLVALKTPALALLSAQGLRALAGQRADLATALDIRWLGLSYIAFRLIHTLRDRQTGRLPAADLPTYLSYVIFFPSLIAGPIDRLERFQRDFCAPLPEAGLQLSEAGRRVVLGLFKKFVLADTLALVALSPQNALQVRETGWLWLLLYLYAFQIYFDFAGYTDIAIGIGLALGVKLPENFNAPYAKPNLTQFWNSWHMSLTLWFRAYFFNPFVRWLRGPKIKASPVTVLLLSQVATMLLIGLWHGVTVNFVMWGLWHGLGLFAQNRWTDLTRAWFGAREWSPAAQRALNVCSVLLTFHYVMLGWVWFALPSPGMALEVFKRLAGGL